MRLAVILQRATWTFSRHKHTSWQLAATSGTARSSQAIRQEGFLSMAASSTSPTLSFWDRNPAYAAVAAAKLSGSTLVVQPDAKGTKDTAATLSFPSGDQIVGLPLILRYVVRSGSAADLYASSDALASTQVDYWLDYSTFLVNGPTLEPACASINEFLALRSFLVGFSLTLADLAVWGQLQAAVMWKALKKSGKMPHLSRWFDHVSEVPQVAAAVEELDPKRKPAVADGPVNAKKAASGGKPAAEGGSFDVDLPGAEMGKVVTRFPPEPSGYLHIGHAKAALLNNHFAQMYKGKLLVRFDDTNPSKEKDEFVENIIKDINDLELKYERITYTSDYFPQLLEAGERLIKAGLMYADDTPVEQMREERLKSIESRCRSRLVEENLRIWEEMKKGSEVGLANAMRFKIDMKSPNGALRDPVAFRCNLTHHWRTGNMYKLYPTYDCACPFVDAMEGVTHALRTSEYKDREDQYYWVLKAMQKVWPGLPNVHIWDYSRLNFVNTVLSKRKLTWFVDTGRVEGWNDARMPTVQGVLRRGLKIEALKEFILSQGASRNITFQEWDKIWTINKRIIDPVAPRHTAIEVQGRVPFTLSNGPSELEVVTVPRHKKYPPAGKKSQLRTQQIWLEQVDARELVDGEEVTLMDWGNAIIKTIHKDASGAVTSIDAELHLEGDVKKTKWKLTWLAQSDELVELQLVDFDYLINKRKIEEEDDFQSLVNEKTRFDTLAHGDINMRTLQKGDIIQLERKGYYIVDEPLIKAGKPIVLFNIPDGRSKNMTK